jgi:twinkle protein
MTVERREACPECVAAGGDTKGDNLVFYENGTAFCHSCNKDTSGGAETTTIVDTEANEGLLSGRYAALDARGISEDTCKKYSYMLGNGCHIANILNESGTVVAQKIRKANKEFTILGDRAALSQFYGQWLFTPNDKLFITITEGELDALSVAEAFECRWPVVSLTNGAQSAKRQIEKNLDYLHKFKYVVLAFDNDEAGKKATQECLNLFEPGKVRVCTWKEKDANDMLRKGMKRAISKCVYDAVEYMPSPIKTGEALTECLRKHRRETVPWPFDSANKMIGEIELGRVYTICARPGVGKTEMGQSLINQFVQEERNVGIIPLEQSMSEVILKTHDKIYGTHYFETKNDNLTEDVISECSRVMKHLVIYDNDVRGASLDEMKANIPYMARSGGCDVIIYDNLSYSAGTDTADWQKLDNTITMFKTLALKYNFAFIVICHLNRKDSQLNDGNPMPHENDIRGSQGLEMFSDVVLGLWRDTKAEDEEVRNTLHAHVLKDRITGQAKGKSFALSYDSEKGVLVDYVSNFS